MKIIEVEFRARFDESESKRLAEYLSQNAKNLGKDDKNVYFFVLPNQLLKVAHNVSKKSAKIGLKLSKIGAGSAFEEIEFDIPIEGVSNAVRLFENLDLVDGVVKIESFQQRTNYELDGVELSLKYSEHWGHHMELEIVVDDESKVKDAEQKIKALADTLELTLMTDDELLTLTNSIQQKSRKEKF